MRFLTVKNRSFVTRRKLVRKSQAGAFALLLAAILTACSSTANKNVATPESSPTSANEFLIIDCLLPGQVKKLGSKFTFLAPRRPIKTSGSDCEIRGGEYVAYDRSDYSTALKVWLPLAQEGSAEAQTYVGEIYEKGLGLMPDYQVAAHWYQKAVEQNFSRAQINLGHLYEQGLGVDSDKQQALNLYRLASGISGDKLLFASTLSATHVPLKTHKAVQTELTEQQQQSAQLQQQSAQLQQQLRRLDKALQTQTSVLVEAEQQLQTTENELEQMTKAQPASDQQPASAEGAELEVKIATLEAEHAQLEQQLSKINEENQQLETNQQSISEKLSSTENVKAGYQQQITQTQQQLADTRQQLLLSKAALQMERVKRDQALSEQSEEHSLAVTEQQQQLAQLSSQYEQQVAQVNRQKHEIEKLKREAKQYSAKVAPAAAAPALLAANTDAPRIEIIEPPVILTRSQATVRLRALEEQRQVIGKVSAPAGLVSLSVNGVATELADNNLFRASVPIKGDPTPVDVVVIDGEGRRAAIAFSFVNPAQSVKGAQISALDLPKPKAAAGKVGLTSGNYYALIIGNNDYQNLSTLATAVNDAQATDRLLREKYNFRTKLLLNANRYDIMSALNEFRTTLKKSDNLLIYYAGHGKLDEASKRGYWLPIDADDDNNANWISNGDITNILSSVAAKHVLVVADSCYSGTLTQTPLARVATDVPDDVRAEWIKIMDETRARITLTSGGLEPVLDGGGGAHSVFAKAFLDALRNNDGILEGYSLYYQVLDNMQQSSATLAQAQVPQYAPIHMAGHESGEFLFNPG